MGRLKESPFKPYVMAVSAARKTILSMTKVSKYFTLEKGFSEILYDFK